MTSLYLAYLKFTVISMTLIIRLIIFGAKQARIDKPWINRVIVGSGSLLNIDTAFQGLFTKMVRNVKTCLHTY